MEKKRAGLLIKEIHGLLEKKANKILAADDLTMSQVGILIKLQSKERKMSYKELEKDLGLAQSTTVGLISRLEKKGMVRTFTDPSDARIKYATLTEEGILCCGKAEAAMKDQEEILLKYMDPEERSQLLDYLSRIKEALQKQ